MPDLLLVGAGHTHLHVIARAADLVAAGYRVSVLSPRTFHYSGVASATAAGELAASGGQVDVAALAGRSGVDFHEGLITDIDLDANVAVSDAGTKVPYDVISFNIGSVVEPPGMTVRDDVVRVKPLSSLAGLHARLADPALGGAARVTVVGGGSSGLELAAHLSARPDVAQVLLLEAGPDLAPDLPDGAGRRLARLLARRGVHVRTGCAISFLGVEQAHCADGSTVTHDVAVLATGLGAPRIVEHLGLGDGAGIPVRATLQHADHDHVYAAGDCALFLPSPLPKVGVHGVRQGPVLLSSLLARASGEPLPTYVPARTYLSILALGAGSGLAVRGRRWWLGRSALWLKWWIDRRWLATYQLRG